MTPMTTSRRGRPAITAVALVVVTPIASWWILTLALDKPLPDPDYMIRPLRIDPMLGGPPILLGLNVVAVVNGYRLHREAGR